MTRFQFDTKEQICWKALSGEMEILAAAEALLNSDKSMQDPFSFVYPDAEILEEMLETVRLAPKEREAVVRQYREPVLRAFHTLLEIFTAPEDSFVPAPQIAIPRSPPDNTT